VYFTKSWLTSHAQFPFHHNTNFLLSTQNSLLFSRSYTCHLVLFVDLDIPFYLSPLRLRTGCPRCVKANLFEPVYHHHLPFCLLIGLKLACTPLHYFLSSLAKMYANMQLSV
jgi:hypothetical protein